MLISERIYKYLEEKGMSQIDFANRTGSGAGKCERMCRTVPFFIRKITS